MVKTSHQTFKQPEMRAALPALIVAVQEDPDLKATMWHEFAEPAVKLFAQDPTSSAQESRLDAVAVLLMAAGAGWLTATAIDDDAADALCRRIEELLTVAVAGQE